MEAIIESIKEFFIVQPGRLSVPCDLLTRLLSGVLLLGLVGQVVMTGHKAVFALGAQPVADLSLARLIPGAPTWFVPETIEGYLLVVILIAATFWGRAIGRRIDEFHKHI